MSARISFFLSVAAIASVLILLYTILPSPGSGESRPENLSIDYSRVQQSIFTSDITLAQVYKTILESDGCVVQTKEVGLGKTKLYSLHYKC